MSGVAALWAAGASTGAVLVSLWSARRSRSSDRERDRISWNREELLVSLKRLNALAEDFVDAVDSSESTARASRSFIALSKESREFDFASKGMRAACHDLMSSAGLLHSAVIEEMGSVVIDDRRKTFVDAYENWLAQARTELGSD